MRAHVLNKGALRNVPMGLDDPAAEQPLLSRWCPAERRYVIAVLDWDDPLDAVVALELMRFRAGFDLYDA